MAEWGLLPEVMDKSECPSATIQIQMSLLSCSPTCLLLAIAFSPLILGIWKSTSTLFKVRMTSLENTGPSPHLEAHGKDNSRLLQTSSFKMLPF